jgi:hypothetical protein
MGWTFIIYGKVNAYRVLIGEPHRERLLRRPRAVAVNIPFRTGKREYKFVLVCRSCQRKSVSVKYLSADLPLVS